jgi:hypothetical protein
MRHEFTEHMSYLDSLELLCYNAPAFVIDSD